jgi:Ras-related GTP-binding protein C/D
MQSPTQPAQAKPGEVSTTKPQDPKPRLLLMGLRRYSALTLEFNHEDRSDLNRSGKSSIASVVFHKMPPNETLFLESTTRIQKDSIQ